MWAIAEELFLFLIALVFITEFVIPLLTDKPFFGSFRKTKPVVKKEETKKPDADPNDLKEKIKDAKEKVAEVKKVQDEVTEFHKSAEDLKKDSDNMLK